MTSSIAYERAVGEENVLGKYADTKEEAFNLLFSGMLMYRGKIIGQQVVQEMYETHPPVTMTEKEYNEYGAWVIEGEITDTLLKTKRKFSNEIYNIRTSYTPRSNETVMKMMDAKYLEYQEKYITHIDSVLTVIALGIRMKLTAFSEG